MCYTNLHYYYYYYLHRVKCIIIRESVDLCPGQLVGKSAGLVIEILRVRIPAEVVGEFSSPELTLCVDSYSMSVPPPCYRSGK